MRRQFNYLVKLGYTVHRTESDPNPWKTEGFYGERHVRASSKERAMIAATDSVARKYALHGAVVTFRAASISAEIA